MCDTRYRAQRFKGRVPLHPDITPAMIERLVHAFYDKVRRDPMLAGAFDPVIGERWPAHLETMCAFWRSVMLLSGDYKGKPVEAHVRLEVIMPVHFDRWLTLWTETVYVLCPTEIANLFVQKAERMADRFVAALSTSALPTLDTPSISDREDAYAQ